MAYSSRALARRRCAHIFPEGHTRAGYQCRAFARWDSPGALEGGGLCTAHAGKTRGADFRGSGKHHRYECRTVPKCSCAAYPFPHRPGGGLCRWPDPPRRRLQPRTAYGHRLRNPPRRWGAPAAEVRTAPDVTPDRTPDAAAVAPTVSGNPTPVRPADSWLAHLARLLGT